MFFINCRINENDFLGGIKTKTQSRGFPGVGRNISKTIIDVTKNMYSVYLPPDPTEAIFSMKIPVFVCRT